MPEVPLPPDFELPEAMAPTDDIPLPPGGGSGTEDTPNKKKRKKRFGAEVKPYKPNLADSDYSHFAKLAQQYAKKVEAGETPTLTPEETTTTTPTTKQPVITATTQYDYSATAYTSQYPSYDYSTWVAQYYAQGGDPAQAYAQWQQWTAAYSQPGSWAMPDTSVPPPGFDSTVTGGATESTTSSYQQQLLAMVNPLLYNQAGNKNPPPNPPSLYMMFYVYNKEKMINRKAEVNKNKNNPICSYLI